MTSTATSLLLTSILMLAVTTEATSTRLLERLLQPAIRTAVARLEVEERRLEITSLEQEGCSLVWSVSSSVPVLYLVAGVDRAGMLSLVASSLQQPRLQLRPALTARFQQVTVVAVTRGGVMDTSTITLNTVDTCGEQREDDIYTVTEDEETESEEGVTSTVAAPEDGDTDSAEDTVATSALASAAQRYWALLLAAAAALAVLLLAALVRSCTRHRGDKQGSQGELVREAFLVLEV